VRNPACHESVFANSYPPLRTVFFLLQFLLLSQRFSFFSFSLSSQILGPRPGDFSALGLQHLSTLSLVLPIPHDLTFSLFTILSLIVPPAPLISYCFLPFPPGFSLFRTLLFCDFFWVRTPYPRVSSSDPTPPFYRPWFSFSSLAADVL